MSRIVLIEKRLQSIGQAHFQEMCDILVTRETKDVQEVYRNGSVSGKSKTRTGTPDTAILQTSGRYILVEHTTNISEGISKIKEDIEKCLDPSKTGIKLEKVNKVVICSNFKITSLQREKLSEIVNSIRINLEIFDIHNIAIKLYHNHSDLLKEYLNITIGKGQVVNINKFKKDYSSPTNANITIFDNEIIGRNNDLQKLEKLFRTNRIVIVTGKAGVGKTRLSMDAMVKYCSKTKIIPCCLSYKNDSLIDDFEYFFDKSQKYLLLVDDANRIDSIRQLISLVKDSRYDNVNLCMTVRDYGVFDLHSLLDPIVPFEVIKIDPLDKESIENILENTPFNIKDKKAISDISRLADGNPRLALMAANLYTTKGRWNVVNNSNEIYKKYFNSIVSDNKSTFTIETIQTLGLIAFFYSLVIEDTIKLDKILNHFSLSQESFHKSLDILNKLEMVQIHDYVVKIPDQNLSSFFFYKCFIEDRNVKFSTLVVNYFESHSHRFKDCVIAVNNMFGATEVCGVLKPILKDILLEENNSINKYNLISTFYWILRDEAIVYLFQLIENIEYEPTDTLSVKYKQNEFSHSKDSILSLLKNYFLWSDGLKEALQLALSYVSKKNSALPELAYHLKAYLMIRYEDHENGYYRQNVLIDLLTNEGEDLIEYRKILFYQLAKELLSTEFQYVEGNGKGSIIINTINIPPNDSMRKLRRKIWNYIDFNFKSDRALALDTISTYPAFRFKHNTETVHDDLGQLVDLLAKNIEFSNFNEAVIVYNLHRRLKLYNVNNQELDSLIRMIDSPILEFYKIMNWRWFGSKYMSDYDYDTYADLKRKQLHEKVLISNGNDIKQFITNLESILKVKNQDKHIYEVGTCVNEVIANTASVHPNLGLDLTIQLIGSGMGYICNDVFIMARLLIAGVDFEEALAKLQNLDSKVQGNWMLALHIAIKEETITLSRCKSMLKSIENAIGGRTIFATHFLKYIPVDKSIFSKIFHASSKRNLDSRDKIFLFNDFFDEHYINSRNDLKIVKEVYKKQTEIQEHFDYNHKGLLNIVKDDKSFLLEFITDVKLRDDNSSIPEIWSIPGIEAELEKVFLQLVNQEYFFGISDHLTNIFFRKLDTETQERASQFLLNLLDKYHADVKIINAIADISNRSLKGFIKVIIHRYLELNSDPKHFSRITWISTNGVFSGKESSSDRQISRIRRLMDIIEEVDNIKYLPIKVSLIKEMEYWKAESKKEQRRRFADPFQF